MPDILDGVFLPSQVNMSLDLVQLKFKMLSVLKDVFESTKLSQQQGDFCSPSSVRWAFSFRPPPWRVRP